MSASAACWSSRALPGPATQRRTRSFARSRPLHCGAAGPGTGGISNGTTDLASGAGSAAAAAAAAAAATPTSSSCSAVDAFPAAIAAAVCDEPSLAPRSPVRWPQKSELYILRSDGYSCTRETVQREQPLAACLCLLTLCALCGEHATVLSFQHDACGVNALRAASAAAHHAAAAMLPLHPLQLAATCSLPAPARSSSC